MSSAPPPEGRDAARVRVRVEGTVQGVGFRPYVYRLASELELAGWVLNDERGVLLEVEGAPSALDRFLERLAEEAPPLATVERVASEALPPEGRAAGGARAFEILESGGGERPSALVSPDTATCADCLRELFDPEDRRWRYPFINCTNCGPRFTIVRGIPYDRPNTTMAGFTMCPRCRAEYEDPTDRRFHAQPNACPECGPRAELVGRDGAAADLAGAPDPVAAAAAAIGGGRIVAVKGLGGFHLACRADHAEAVAELRGRKHREDKPFAIMVPGLPEARELVELGPEEEALLLSRERPIVLARRREEAAVAGAVAPGHRDLGVMLPYSPLHHLLLADAGTPLVMTSGNVSDEPICFRDEEALERLSGIADLFLLNDRPIETRTDDSVVRVVEVTGERRPMMLRRSRGYVPAPVELVPAARRPLLACGGHLKNTFTVARGSRAWVGPHIGDLENFETLLSFEEGVAHLERLFEVEPEVIVHDLHPEYLSAKYARERRRERVAGEGPDAAGLGVSGEGAPQLVGVQHHHAHMAGCLAEHGETGPALGAIFDGTGYGTDGTVWGGEILAGDVAGFERAGHLWPVRLPGGEAAIREPWRMACAWLTELGGAIPEMPAGFEGRVEPADWRNVARLALDGFASPVTTSMGRLFDAVSALCGTRLRVTYEGQAAIELEMVADGVPARREGGATGAGGEGSGPVPPAETYPLPWIEGEGGIRLLDARATVRAVLEDVAAGEAAGRVAARFHEGVARGTAAACAEAAGRLGLDTVVLSGGVFQNVRLLERTSALLSRAGLRPLVPERLPPNDGGLSYGQAASAAARPGVDVDGAAGGGSGAGRTTDARL